MKKIAVKDGALIDKMNANLNKPKTETVENRARVCVPKEEYNTPMVETGKSDLEALAKLKAAMEKEGAKVINTVPETESTDGKKPSYEMVNHPSHYNSSSIETIEKMRRIWGNENTALWCEMTAFKYRDRIGNKPDNSNDQEVGKIKWYEAKAKELRVE